MRILLAVLAIAVMAGAVHAQDASGGGGHKGRHQNTDQTQGKTDQQKKAVDDAYRQAIKGIPDKEKPDPWKNAR